MNDIVYDFQGGTIIFQGAPADVKLWLETPGNMGDRTFAKFGDQAIEPFTNSYCYATEYLDSYDSAYPNG